MSAMGRLARVWQQVINGGRNVRFADLLALAVAFGFELRRTKGSHHILVHPVAGRLLNLQPAKDGTAKPYQIRQFLDIVEEHGLGLEDAE
jgi:predicted RNA binding protein YcfA (HicA-like mRNA interferase family)